MFFCEVVSLSIILTIPRSSACGLIYLFLFAVFHKALILILNPYPFFRSPLTTVAWTRPNSTSSWCPSVPNCPFIPTVCWVLDWTDSSYPRLMTSYYWNIAELKTRYIDRSCCRRPGVRIFGGKLGERFRAASRKSAVGWREDERCSVEVLWKILLN